MSAGKRSLGLVLLLSVITMLAGCSNPVGGPLAEESGTAQVEPGDARTFGLEAQGAIRFEYQAAVAQGPDIDVFILDDQNYQRYQSGEDFTYFECSSLGTGSASGTCELPAGTYHMVLDNTERGEASPATVSTGSQTASVDYEFTATAA